jgi:phenylacetic acid degradation operon negative regulatory protein
VTDSDDGLGLRPLTARSVILSVLLGSHPPELPVRSLVRTTALFGISEGSARVALSRLAAEGDVSAEGGRYRLSDRLLARQRRQDEARRPATRAWRGAWEIAVLRPGRTSETDRTGLEAELGALGLAQLRTGVWTRPANLQRVWPGHLLEQVWCFEGRPADAPTPGPGASDALAPALWDLDGWSRQAERLIEALEGATEPARRFTVAAAVVRHLQLDPLLPPSLLAAGWPGDRLRSAYGGYVTDLGRLLRAERARQRSTAVGRGQIG